MNRNANTETESMGTNGFAATYHDASICTMDGSEMWLACVYRDGHNVFSRECDTVEEAVAVLTAEMRSRGVVDFEPINTTTDGARTFSADRDL